MRLLFFVFIFLIASSGYAFDPSQISSCSDLKINGTGYSLGPNNWLKGFEAYDFKECYKSSLGGNPCDCFNKISEFDKLYLRSVFENEKKRIQQAKVDYWSDSFQRKMFGTNNVALAIDNFRVSGKTGKEVLGKTPSCRIGLLFENLKEVSKKNTCNKSHFKKVTNKLFSRSNSGGDKSLEDLKNEFTDFLQPIAGNGLPKMTGEAGRNNKKACFPYKSYMTLDNLSNGKEDDGYVEQLVGILFSEISAKEFKKENRFNPHSIAFVGDLQKGSMSELLEQLDSENSWDADVDPENILPIYEYTEGESLKLDSRKYYRALEQNPVIAAIMSDKKMKDELLANFEKWAGEMGNMGLAMLPALNEKIKEFVSSKNIIDKLAVEQNKSCERLFKIETVEALFCKPDDLPFPSQHEMTMSFPFSIEDEDEKDALYINEAIKFNKVCQEKEDGVYKPSPLTLRKSPLERAVDPSQTPDSELRKLWKDESKFGEKSDYEKFNESVCSIMGDCIDNPEKPECSNPTAMFDDVKKRVADRFKTFVDRDGVDMELAYQQRYKEFLDNFPNYEIPSGLVQGPEGQAILDYFNVARSLNEIHTADTLATAPSDLEGPDTIESTSTTFNFFKHETGESETDGVLANYYVVGTPSEEEQIRDWEERRSRGEDVGTSPPFEPRNLTPTTARNNGGNNINIDPGPTDIPTQSSPVANNDVPTNNNSRSSTNLPKNRNFERDRSVKVPEPVIPDLPSNQPDNESDVFNRSNSKPTSETNSNASVKKPDTSNRPEIEKPKENSNQQFTRLPASKNASKRVVKKGSSAPRQDFGAGNLSKGGSSNRFASNSNSNRSRSDFNNSPFDFSPPPSNSGAGSFDSGDSKKQVTGKGNKSSSAKSSKKESSSASSSLAGINTMNDGGVLALDGSEAWGKYFGNDKGRPWVYPKVFKCPMLTETDKVDKKKGKFHEVVSTLGLDGMMFRCVVANEDEADMFTLYEIDYRPVKINGDIISFDSSNYESRKMMFQDIKNISLGLKIEAMGYTDQIGLVNSGLNESFNRINKMAGAKFSTYDEMMVFINKKWMSRKNKSHDEEEFKNYVLPRRVFEQDLNLLRVTRNRYVQQEIRKFTKAIYATVD